MLAADTGDRLDLRPAENLAAGVRRSIQNDGAGARGNRGLQRIAVQRPVRSRERHQNRVDAHRFQGRHVVAVKRLEQQHFIAGVQQRHGRGMQSGGGAAGHKHFRLGVILKPVLAFLLGGDRRAQPRNAVQPGVNVMAGANRA